MTFINWEVAKEDAELINDICRRGDKMLQDTGIHEDFLGMVMDITTVHANGNPLRLKDFLNADNFNFAHDFYGILNNVDRATGKLNGHFLPRFSIGGTK